MAQVKEVQAARRTQEQRSTETRRRILDATVSCLQEYGYAGTTTVRVVEHAGVTRGALAHHFASKADMVAAAVGHIAATRSQDAFPQIEKALASKDPIDAGLDLLWAMHQGTAFVALVELWVAARTDPDLQRRIKFLEHSTNSMLMEFALELFHATENVAVRHAIYTAMDTARGIQLMKMVTTDSDAEHEARWRRAKANLRIMFEHALAHNPAQMN
ncbi:TetR/AcrR family transcriptional regulator [Pseudonocardia acaciae]|uniref:TetR/AcrR family transcriptional regulator n=1 Tax=Pseudonocardia acaciae TaxID=551276 RepID=UPI000A0327E3|nr:TetR/AcrR family transcriptional regulator [Pseudonocardia acaciae]